MTKLINLKLSKIKYSGDSIGDDIRVEVECLDKFIGFNIRLKKGTERKLDREIGQFFADQPFLNLPINIKIIERDLIFNDVGTDQIKFKVNLNTSKTQTISSVIEIQELRNYQTKKKAIFEITFEAQILDVILYVSLEQSENGWIVVRKEDDKIEIGLPAYLKVRLEKQDTKRQYFVIMEGSWLGTKASVEIQKDGTSYLELTNQQTGPIHLIYSRSQKTLKFKNKIYKVREYKKDLQPWKNILYDIKIPDYYHGKGRPYLDRAKLAPVWFKTTHPGDDRYVHVGTYSLGCVTIIEIERWDELCKILMKARKGDGQSIGTLEVID